MSHYTVTASWGLSHGLPMVGGYGGGDSYVIMGRHVIKGITIKQIKKILVEEEAKKQGKITLDDSKVVQLGGPFEKIGEQDEVVGGRSQKVGSKNKR